MNSLGNRIKYLRDKMGFSQKRVANSIGISNVQLSRYESDDRKPVPETIRLLADFFNVSSDYLLGRTDDPNEKFYEKDMEFEGFFGFDLDSLSDSEITELKENIKKEISFYLWQKENEKNKHFNTLVM